MTKSINRRTLVRTSAMGLFGLVNLPASGSSRDRMKMEKVSSHFPNIDPQIVQEIVGKSHFDLDYVKKHVEARPELARSVWEWRFGDFESAIGAASHVGRRDIALYLLSKGARTTIFTHVMLGHLEVVRAMIQSIPGIQKTMGPHGLSLLHHAYAGKQMKDTMTGLENEAVEMTIEYLENLGDAGGETYIEISPEDQKKYLGDYKYGDGEKEGFTIELNMRKLLALGPIGGFGGALYKINENEFIYNGAPSVIITFDIQAEKVKSLTLREPGLTLHAKKVS